MSIFRILKFSDEDIGAGSIQGVDEMTVVPLIGENLGNVAEPLSLKFKRTDSYGSMVYENTDKELSGIIPTNIMVRGFNAQDHAMAGSGIITANKTTKFTNACCIESGQGGYLQDKGNDYDILPIELRKNLLPLKMRDKNRYDKLWPDISKWLAGTGVSKSIMQSHLRYFYDNPQIKESLEEFSASFEPVSNQIGAVILFKDKVVGIEIMPSVQHWESYWKLLIRGCYGAELLRLKKLGKINSSLKLPKFKKGDKVEHLELIVDNFLHDIRKDILQIIDNIKIKNASILNKIENFETILIETDSGGGDLITQDKKPIYLSLVL